MRGLLLAAALGAAQALAQAPADPQPSPVHREAASVRGAPRSGPQPRDAAQAEKLRAEDLELVENLDLLEQLQSAEDLDLLLELSGAEAP